MTTATTTTELATVGPELSDAERYALAAFLAGYPGLTRDAYAVDLRQSSPGARSTSCASSRSAGRTSSPSPATSKLAAALGRRLPVGCARWPASTRYAEQEGLLERSPAAHVRRPRLDYESHPAGLDRNEVGALLVAAGLRPRASTRSSRCTAGMPRPLAYGRRGTRTGRRGVLGNRASSDSRSAPRCSASAMYRASAKVTFPAEARHLRTSHAAASPAAARPLAPRWPGPPAPGSGSGSGPSGATPRRTPARSAQAPTAPRPLAAELGGLGRGRCRLPVRRRRTRR